MIDVEVHAINISIVNIVGWQNYNDNTTIVK